MLVEGTYKDIVSSPGNTIGKQSPSRFCDKKSIFHLVKIRDKQKLIDSLNENVYNPSDLDENGETPLMVACKHKRTANAFTLLDFYGEHALPEFISSNGLSALYHSRTSINLIDRLLSYTKVLSTLGHVFPCGNTVLTLLLSSWVSQNIDFIIYNMSIVDLNHRTRLGKTALIMLVELSEYALCRKLIIKGVNTQIYDESGYTALSYLMYEIEENLSKERLDLCFMCFEGEPAKTRCTELKSYSINDFNLIGAINMTDIISTYGELKWVMDGNGNVKIVKFFKSYKESKLIPDDLSKELVFIKELRLHSNNIINLEGTFTDMDGNIHLVFEPLALTLRDYFYLIKLYSKIDPTKTTMIMRVELAYKKLSSTLNIIHDFGFLHNDIKLNNIMIGYDGQLRIIDFGISNFIGFSPYERVIDSYITTVNIKAPDYGRRLIVNFLKRVNGTSYKAIRSISIDTSKKSYNSDVYSLSVSFIQGILSNSERYISFEGNIYKVLNLKKEEKKDDDNLNITQISDIDLDKLKKYKFFEDIKMGISIDSNSRVKKNSNYIDGNITEFKSSNELLNYRIRHYTDDEIRNSKYEVPRINKIFSIYSSYTITMNPCIYSDTVLPIFTRILSTMNNKISIDTYYNAIYNSVNYNGTSDMKVVCIAYLYIFSHLFEWSLPSIDKFAIEFQLPADMLIGNVNSLISTLLPNVTIIPFILIVENMIIKLQIARIPSNLIADIERVVFVNLLAYISGDKTKCIIDKSVYLWDFVQCFSYNVCSFPPFEVSYQSETILDVFSKF